MNQATEILSLDSYNSIDSIDFGETVTFIKFGTDWCDPCKKLHEVLLGVPMSIIYNVDVQNDEFEQFLSENRIYNIPTTIIKYKKYKTQFAGVRTLEELKKIVDVLKENVNKN